MDNDRLKEAITGIKRIPPAPTPIIQPTQEEPKIYGVSGEPIPQHIREMMQSPPEILTIGDGETSWDFHENGPFNAEEIEAMRNQVVADAILTGGERRSAQIPQSKIRKKQPDVIKIIDGVALFLKTALLLGVLIWCIKGLLGNSL